MKRCGKCGAQNIDAARFCKHCGSFLNTYSGYTPRVYTPPVYMPPVYTPPEKIKTSTLSPAKQSAAKVMGAISIGVAIVSIVLFILAFAGVFSDNMA